MAEKCQWCGGTDTRGTCPRSIACPRCKGRPGGPCYRPSGHKAAALHSDRVRLAEATPEAAAEAADDG